MSPGTAGEIAYRIDTFAGTADVGDGGPAVDALLDGAEGLAFDPSGNLYIADNVEHRIRRIDAANGKMTTIAGDGQPGYSGDGGPASEAELYRPYGLAFAGDELYVADFGNGRVRVIGADGNIRTVAGGGSNGGSAGAVAARLAGPRNIVVDAAGKLYISDFLDNRIYVVLPNGTISPFAGTGAAGHNGDGPATASDLNAPAGLAVDLQGIVYIADSGNNLVRKVVGGRMETVLGDGIGGVDLSAPTGVAVDRGGNLYVADSGNARLLRLSATGTVLVMAEAAMVRDVAVSQAGRVVFSTGQRVFGIAGVGAVYAMAGCTECDAIADGALATEVRLSSPVGVAVGPVGTVYIADEGSSRVLHVDLAGKVEAAAGTGTSGHSGDGGPAAQAELLDPVSVTTGLSGDYWIADYLGQRVRRVNQFGVITTIAGTGNRGFSGDGGSASSARLNRPRGITTDAYGNLYIADSRNHRIRKLSPDGAITTVAGTGVPGHSGDRGLGYLAQLDTPSALAVDDEGNVYIAEHGSHVVRMLRSDGFLLTVAGSGTAGFSGDGGSAVKASLNAPSGLAVDTLGNLFIADTENQRIRRVSADGIIDTIAGVGEPGFGGDGGPALNARFRQPADIAIDLGTGALYVADAGNGRIRKLTPIVAPPPVVEPASDCNVLHAASFRSGPVAPGELVTVFAEGVGPAQPSGAQVTASGTIANTVGDMEVSVDGSPAPILFAGRDQLNIQIPYSIDTDDQAVLEVRIAGELITRATLDVRLAVPGLFVASEGTRQVLAVNEDGGLNSVANPAAPGEVVTFYATGEGATSPASIAGRPASYPYPKPILPVQVRIGGLPAEVLYAGAAPGLVGMMQLNVRVPPAFIPHGALRLELFVGGVSSQSGVTISVR